MQKDKKQILFLDHTPFVGGAQLSLIQHIEALNKEKFDVLLICTKKAKEIGLTDKYKEAGINYIFVPIEKLKVINPIVFFRFLKSVIRINKIIQKQKVDLVVSNTVRVALVGSLAAWLSGKKLAWFIRDFTFPLYFFKFFSHFPKKIIFNSKATASYYDKYLKDKEKEAVVYIGRDFYKKVKNVSNNEIIKQRQAWEANAKTIVVGFVGRLVLWKGPQVLIKAIDLLIKQGVNNNIKCVIIGTGKGQGESNEVELKKMVKDLNLEDYIIFTGYIKDLAITMKSLDILALASIEPEPFSSTVVDAMMAKVPVIGTNIGGTPEIIRNNRTGLLVKPADVNELDRAIKRLVNNKKLREEIAENAYNYIMEHHTAKFITRQLEDIYLESLRVD